MLRSDPSFKQLPQGSSSADEQQLNSVHSMSDEQRQRRPARAEGLSVFRPKTACAANPRAGVEDAAAGQTDRDAERVSRSSRSVPP
jgi:hypothetical protein